MEKEAFIVCDNVVKIYKIAELETVALQGLDLIVERNEMLGIIGPSGSGKSTLMNILGGLDRPSAGRVWVDGQDLLKLNDAGLDYYRQTKVGFVWQQGSRNLVPYLNAIENVILPMTLAGRKAEDNHQRAMEILESVQIADRMHHRLEQMSGGEQQRVAIAVALANQPTMLLADEPTGEVDSATALSIYQTLRDLNQRLGITIIIVSHDANIARHVNRVVAIRDGKTATETIRRTVQTNPTDENAVQTEAVQEEHIFEELIVLDSAGRLQIPKDFLEAFSIKGRVRLEKREEGIMILAAANTAKSTDHAIMDAAASSKTQGWRHSKIFQTIQTANAKTTALYSGVSSKLKEWMNHSKKN